MNIFAEEISAKGLIALMTDFGLDDVFVGVMKGVIAGINPQAQVIDISHGLPSFDVMEAAVRLKWAYPWFPEGTIITTVIDPGVGSERGIIAASAHGRLFVAPDNGLLRPTIDDDPQARIFRVKSQEFFLPHVSGTFHGRDIFAPVAAHLSRGVGIEKVGPDIGIDDIVKLTIPEPTQNPDGSVEGEVIIGDKFGNLISNIPRSMIESIGAFGELEISIGELKIEGISRAYSDAPPGAPAAVISSMDTLEIACNMGSARDMTGADKGDRVVVKRR